MRLTQPVEAPRGVALMQKPSPICVPGRRGGVVGPLGADGLLAGRSHCSFPSALSGLTLHPSPAPLAAGFHVQFHAALGSLNPNHAAPQATGKTVTWNPFVNPLASFLWRCKLRVRDVCTARLAYCSLSFPTGHKDAGMLWILLLGSGQEPWTVDVTS